MKEMNYINTRIKEILYEDDYLGYHFLIVSYGTHPCAYIEIPKTHRWYKKPYTDEELKNIECHGGLTYSDNLSHVLGKEEANGRWFIGWDYGHSGDFEGYYKDFSTEKKWTKEIFEEVKNVIEQIIIMDDEGGGLEALENIGFCPIAYDGEEYTRVKDEYSEDFDLIEKELKRLEKLEKEFVALSKEDEKTKELLSLEIEKNRALEIIKNKRVDVDLFMICKTLEEYNDIIGSRAFEEDEAKQRMLSQEEYDLLKNEIK